MRKKPEHIKKQYALGVSLGITLVILGFWTASHTLSLYPAATAVAKISTPVHTLTASAGDAFGYVRNLFFGANKTQYSSDNVEVVGGKN